MARHQLSRQKSCWADFTSVSLLLFYSPDKGTHWVSEICHLVNHEGKLENIDRQQLQTPIEFVNESGHTSDQDIPGYEKAKQWKRPRVLVSHVPVEYLPRQVLEEGKGKVRK